MAALTGTRRRDTYGYLLQIPSGSTSSLRGVQDGLGVATALQLSSVAARVTGNLTVDGIIAGIGSGLTTLNASQLSTGTLPDGRMPALTGGDVTSASGSVNLALGTTAVTTGSYGSATQVGTFTVNAQGRLTAAANTTISIPASGISDSTSVGRAVLTAANADAAITAVLPSQTTHSGKFLTTNGTTTSWAAASTGGGGAGTVTSVDVSGGATGLAFTGGPVTTSGTLTLTGTLALANGGTGAADAGTARSNLGLGALATLSTVDLSTQTSGTLNLATQTIGTLPVANGGTGQTSAGTAFDALSPLTTEGAILYRSTVNNVSLAGNTTTTRKFLRQTGTGSASAAPVWDTLVVGDLPTPTGVALLGSANTFTALNTFTGGISAYPTGSRNEVYGAGAAPSLGATAADNTIVGYQAGTSLTTGNFNVAIGRSATLFPSGEGNVAVGSYTSFLADGGSNDKSVAVGYIAAVGSSSIAIGYAAEAYSSGNAMGRLAYASGNTIALGVGCVSTTNGRVAVHLNTSLSQELIFRADTTGSGAAQRDVGGLTTSLFTANNATYQGRTAVVAYYATTAQEFLRADASSDQIRGAIGGSVVAGQRLTLNTGVAADKGLVVKGASSQTGNLFEGQDDTGATLFAVRGRTLQRKPLSPSQITSNQNDYAPGLAGYYRLSSDASRNITGLSVSQQDGDEVYFVNAGAQNIVLKHQDTGSTAANRFLCSSGADITLAANAGVGAFYDNTTARWRVMG